MNPIEKLRDHIRREYPRATVELTKPLHKAGFWSLDVDLEDKKLAIEWSEDNEFGVSNIDPVGYGERTDEAYRTLKEIKQRVDRLLTSAERTTPPFGVLLSRLREHKNMTQQELALMLGVRQATISGMERRDDVQLSTLWRVVEALGGALEIYGVFSEARYRIDTHSRGQNTRTQVRRSNEPRDIEIVDAPSLNYEAAFVALNKAGCLQRATERANGISFHRSVIAIP